MALLEPALLARLEAMQLVTRRRLAGSLAGEHRSTRHGSSLDFADQREYHPGDDFRRIDYHVLARLDQLLIRLYEADDDLLVRLVVDTSASMALRDMPNARTRWESATEIVGANAKQMIALAEKFELQRYMFDSSVRAVSRLPGEDAAADKTSVAPPSIVPAGTSTDVAAVNSWCRPSRFPGPR